MNKTITIFLSTLFLWQHIAFSSSIKPSAFEISEEEVTQRSQSDILRLVPRTEIGDSLKILQRVFESGRRQIKHEHKYGQSFPCNPEMLYDLMSQAPGKRVLEIAGASGENAILIGLAGAEHVYLNDIVPEEVEEFQRQVETLKPELKDRFTSIAGDCFDLDEHLEVNSLDIILARNIFHFLKPSQYDDFFELVKRLLKPGGIFAMTVNSRYSEHGVAIDDSEGTLFSTFMTIFDENYVKPIALNRTLSICDDDTKDPLIYTNHHVFNGFTIDSDALEKLPKSLHTTVIESIDRVSGHRGQLRILENIIRLFTPENLSSLVENAGLEVTSTHHIGTNGHYISEEQAKTTGACFVGLIAGIPMD
ncbi:MAG: methyltransferase domain-containing protein [Alphaproteobacteria bacterium]|nr:methyltransferase domain-containing protein [Alphaproteobacteria bacterium]NCQ66640.1 methyltransferase domain-containing protein [Alphaproteobacteria bacterium]NCT06992.1 methyltransferase domain-containing protein [Alphaproteobacteria bacterium]